MSKLKKTTSKTVTKHLRAFADYLDESDCSLEKEDAADRLNTLLDEWLAMDAFGTEGQLDPRGDHRD